MSLNATFFLLLSFFSHSLDVENILARMFREFKEERVDTQSQQNLRGKEEGLDYERENENIIKPIDDITKRKKDQARPMCG